MNPVLVKRFDETLDAEKISLAAAEFNRSELDIIGPALLALVLLLPVVGTVRVGTTVCRDIPFVTQRWLLVAKVNQC